MLIYIVIIGVLPILFISFFYYRSEVRDADELLNYESQKMMQRLDEEINLKTSRLQNVVDILFDDSGIQQLMRQTDEMTLEKRQTLGMALEKMLRIERELETVVVFLKNDDVFVCGQPLEISDPVRFKLEYGILDEMDGLISWLGTENTLSPEITHKRVVSGARLVDNAYLRDMEHIADIYMFFSNSFFGSENVVHQQAMSNLETAKITGAQRNIYVYDKDTNVVYSTDGFQNDVLSKAPLNVIRKIYGSEEGSTEISIGGAKYVLVYYTASITGLKIVRTIPYKLYYDKYVYIIYVTAILFALLFLLWYALNYFIIRKIISPIQDVVGAMKDVENGNLEVVLNIRSKDEFGIIGRQFNSMVIRLKQLLERVLQEQQKRKESDVLMLEYQMNPHFLYNTLAIIRMEAIKSKNKRVADMLLILGRYLRNTIVNCTRLICVENEVNSINDYISLLQLRYDNLIKTNITVSDEVRKMQIPGMLIQPIIENAVMHGLGDRFDNEEPALLDVGLMHKEDCVIIYVRDNGRGMSPFELEKLKDDILSESTDVREQKNHIGLRNINRRVTMMFGENYGVEIDSEQGKYTEVTVKLPVIDDNEHLEI